MKKLLCLGFILFCSACMVKQPDEADNIGKPVSAEEINAAFAEAQDGVSQEKAFRVGDKGTVQIIDRILGNSGVNSTQEFLVEEINDKYIIYSKRLVETNETSRYGIPRIKTSPAPVENAALHFIKNTFKNIAKLFKKIEINKTTAIGDSFSTSREALKIPLNLSRSVLEQNLKDFLAAKDTSTAPAQTSRYFGLSVVRHLYETENCSQIPGCKVNATKIEFNEIRSLEKGGEIKLRWLYEFSKDVPGLFITLDECFATVIVEGTSQTPLTRCSHVKTFNFGSN